MKKSTKSVIGIIAGVAIATASAIILGVSKKGDDHGDDYDYLDNTDSEDTCVEVED